MGQRQSTSADQPVGYDLQRVQHLLDRCWRELDDSEWNVKLTDVVRLLELKSKLSPAADAERTFWAMINEMRIEELADFGDASTPTEADMVGETGVEECA